MSKKKKKRGNPNIAKYAEGHRFGDKGGADPVAAGSKGGKTSIRKSVRRIAGMTVEHAMSLTDKEILQKLSMAEAVALHKFKRALSGDVRAMQQLEDSVDGKVVEQRIHAEVTLADLVTGSLEYDEEFQNKEPIDAEFETCDQADSGVEA